MILILLLVLILMIFLFISNINHRIIRFIAIAFAGIFMMNFSCMIYLMTFSNYNINSIMDSYTYSFLKALNISIIDNSTIYNTGLLATMLSFLFAGRAMNLYAKKLVVTLSALAVMLFFLLYKDVCYAIQIESTFNDNVILKILRFILQDSRVIRYVLVFYMLLPVVGIVRYIALSRSMINKKNGYVLLLCYIVIDIYILMVFVFGVFKNYFVTEITLYKMPLLGAEILNETVIFFVLFMLLVVMFLMCIYFRPFNSFALISRYFSKYQTLKLGKNSRFVFHSIKNDIFTISLLANEGIEFLEKDLSVLKNSLNEISDIATKSLERLSTLISYLRKGSVNYSFFEVVKCLNKMADALSVWDKAEIEILCEDGEIVYYGDEVLLGEAFLNLFKNAVEAVSNKSENGDSEYVAQIYVRVFVEDEVLCIIFEDNGCGIDRKNLKKVFKSFYTTKLGAKNFGVGLNHVKQIAKVHNGDVFVKSSYGKYTRFAFEIPFIYKSRKR